MPTQESPPLRATPLTPEERAAKVAKLRGVAAQVTKIIPEDQISSVQLRLGYQRPGPGVTMPPGPMVITLLPGDPRFDQALALARSGADDVIADATAKLQAVGDELPPPPDVSIFIPPVKEGGKLGDAGGGQ